jgi:hypothetical protein
MLVCYLTIYKIEEENEKIVRIFFTVFYFLDTNLISSATSGNVSAAVRLNKMYLEKVTIQFSSKKNREK